MTTIPTQQKIEYSAFKKSLNKRGLSNIRDCIWEVNPSPKCEFHKDYKKLLKNYEEFKSQMYKTGGNLIESDATKKNHQLMLFLERKLKDYQKRVENEIKYNELHKEKQRGSVVCYGDCKLSFNLKDITLMHYDSKEYLSCTNKTSESIITSFHSQLSHWASKEIQFRILPKFRSKNVGDVVNFDDEILLESTTKGYFLDYAPDLDHFLNDPDFKLYNDNPFRSEVTVFDLRYQRYKLVFGHYLEVSWRLLMVQDQSENKGEISGLDLIRMTHSEFDGSLTANLKYKCSAPEVYLRSYIGP